MTKKQIEVLPAEVVRPLTSIELVSDSDPDAFYFRGLESVGVTLNEQQIQAVRHGDGPLLVLAGAGSGKTSVVAARVGYLLGVRRKNPENMLMTTFTNKAADEMVERIARMPGVTEKQAKRMTAGTYHSLFLRFLRMYGEKRRVLGGDGAKHGALRRIIKAMGIVMDPAAAALSISQAKYRLAEEEEAEVRRTIPPVLLEIWNRYDAWKAEKGMLDFDDMLLECYRLLCDNPQALDTLQRRYSYVFCDEWQDTNLLQAAIIRKIADPQNNLCVVGDDDQIIMSFQGADSRIILDFGRYYPAARQVKLEVNYRSGPHIIGLANAIIQNNRSRYAKTLRASKTAGERPWFYFFRSAEEEARHVVDDMLSRTQGGRRPKDIAVLFRTVASSRAMQEELLRREVAYQTDGEMGSFFEQPYVAPVLAYLCLALRPDAREGEESVLPYLAIGRDRAQAVLQESSGTLPQRLLRMEGLHPFQRHRLTQHVSLFEVIPVMKPANAIERIVGLFGDAMFTNGIDTTQREQAEEGWRELQESANPFDTVHDFLHHVENMMEKQRRLDGPGGIRLSTIHRAKGLEFPMVYVIGVSEGVLPHIAAVKQSNFEEERRLLYVAVTRAEEELWISSPRFMGGLQRPISRFIQEVDTSGEAPAGDRISSKPEAGRTRFIWLCGICGSENALTSAKDHLAAVKVCPACGGIMRKDLRME